MSKSVTVRFKTLDSIQVMLERIAKMPGVVKTEQVVPGETDLSLGGLYVLQVEESAVKEIVEKLLKEPDVMWAYETPTRTP